MSHPRPQGILGEMEIKSKTFSTYVKASFWLKNATDWATGMTDLKAIATDYAPCLPPSAWISALVVRRTDGLHPKVSNTYFCGPNEFVGTLAPADSSAEAGSANMDMCQVWTLAGSGQKVQHYFRPLILGLLQDDGTYKNDDANYQAAYTTLASTLAAKCEFPQWNRTSSAHDFIAVDTVSRSGIYTERKSGLVLRQQPGRKRSKSSLVKG